MILQDISFSSKPGEKICICGENGSGKSTLLRVLTGAFQPYQGTITFDNIPLNNYDLNSLRSQTGVLFGVQDIFEGTLMENITMGDLEIPLDRIMELAEKIGLSEFFESEKEGLNLRLHPMGKKLSRKITHRILLLRALVHQPRLLLLEDPWLGLEHAEAEKIKHFLLHEMKQATMIISTSDESFARACDQQIRLSNGKRQLI